MELPKLTVKDKKILKLLDCDARESNSQLAKKARLSKNIVNYQIHRLEKEGLIKRYITLIDYSKLGYMLFRVYLDLYEKDLQKEQELMQFLIKNKKTGLVARTSGDWDIIFTLYVKSLDEFNEEWYKFTDKFRDIIKSYNNNLVTREFTYPRNYLLPEKGDERLFWERGGSEAGVGVDEKDQILLKEMLEHARAPVNELAKKIGLGSMAIIYRLRQLEKKGVILGYRAELDFNKLGYEAYKVNLELEDTTVMKEILAYCKVSPGVVSVVRPISDNVDLEFDVEVQDFSDFFKLMDGIKKQFPRAIRDYKYIKILEQHKQVHLPL
ncbi:MAG: winged helix-turn-helix transcriptional regulator [Candidatus Woesearchaeota archaeon]